MSRHPLAPGKNIKYLLYASFSSSLISGCWWIILDNFYEIQTQLGPQKHPWQSSLISIHGILSYCFCIILGITIGQHVLRVWQAKNLRRSGQILLALAAILISSGASLLFLDLGSVKEFISWLHIISGLSFCCCLFVHSSKIKPTGR